MKKYTKDDIKKGDIVGICGDALYEFEIGDWYEDQKCFAGTCTSSYTQTIKIGDVCAVPPDRILVKLGENGKKFPL